MSFVFSSDCVIRRGRCPLGDELPVQTVAELSYGEKVFESTTQQLPGLSESGLTYKINYSAAVDLYWQENIIDFSSLQGLKDSSLNSHSTTPSLTQLAHYAEEAILYRLILPVDSPVVFDYGMGEGNWLLQMKAFGMQPHGYDISALSKAAAARHGIEFRPLQEYPDNFFDLIVATEVFEHLPDPMGAAKLVAAKLKPGGLFNLSTPQDLKIQAKLKKLSAGKYAAAAFDEEFGGLGPLGHINLFSRHSLDAMAFRAGLKRKKIPLIRFFQSLVGPFSWKQLNRFCYNPVKRWLARWTVQYYTK